jgi:hypothetical protein
LASKAVSQLLWSGKGREEWFSLGENHDELLRFGLYPIAKPLGTRENPGNWQKSWKNKPKTEQISVFRLTNA